MKSSGESFEKLLSIVNTLMGENGCPWDRVQTRESLKPYLVEEVYETLEALDNNDPDHIREELGDLFYQILFHSKISELNKEFSIQDVVDSLSEKMVRRHPHVFQSTKLENPDQVLHQWEEIKRQEKKSKPQSILGNVPNHFPGLLRAQKLQKKAAEGGFDWNKIDDVLGKLDEELNELKHAIRSGNHREIESEFGDLFFVLVNVARHLKVNAEEAIRGTNGKFTSRFQYIERKIAETGKELKDTPLDEMERYWQEAKTLESRLI
tara:strand:- start:4572 stop:5366 length:795 start_codon:yes stop_codon:yes gene_type:complete